MLNLIKGSIAASLLISFGVAILLILGEPLGAFLFAFGLLSICYLKLNLFTGKCGYIIENKEYKNLLVILIINLIFGWLFGFILSYTNPSIVSLAAYKIESWTNVLIHFIQSFYCGFIMFIAVDMNKKKTNLGIIYGIPLFIFCKFQHCIANIIILGICHTFSFYIFIAIIGNFLGSLTIWFLSKGEKNGS